LQHIAIFRRIHREFVTTAVPIKDERVSRMFGRNPLPDADTLFLRYFDRWYSDADRERKQFPTTRPDVMQYSEDEVSAVLEMHGLSEEDAAQALDQVGTMLDTARRDFPTYLKIREPVDISWVDAFDQYHHRKRVERLVNRCAADDFLNDYLVITCQFGAVLWHVFSSTLPRLEWLPGNPYWECALFDPRSACVIPVFHWAIKKMSSYGIDDGFAEKLMACVRLLDGEVPSD